MFRPGLETLPVYGVEEPVWRYKLDANERSASLPRTVQEKINRRIKAVDSRRYPDIAALALRSRLAQIYGVETQQVQIGNGSSELIATLCAVFGGAGRAIAYPWPSFSMYPIYAAMADSPAVAIPLSSEFRLSVEMVLQAVEKNRPKLLLLCNPNNPTGGVIPPQDLRAILANVACPVLVDEAYHEYCGESCLTWLEEYPNLMVARTFSKAYGLAAARVGFVIASRDLSAAIGKRVLPYAVNSYSLAAAEACLDCRDSILPEAEKTATRRERLRHRLERLAGIETFASATNFLLLRVQDADQLSGLLAEKSVGVRNLNGAPGLTGCVRVTIGSPAENALLLQGVKAYCESRRG